MSRKLPNINIERSYQNHINGYICGIDEVGRGCLAGPVVAAAIILNFDSIPIGINDSKKLSKKKRQNIYKDIKKEALDIAIGQASNIEIDQMNILNASLLAMKRAYKNLKTPTELALIDGNYAPKINCKTIAIDIETQSMILSPSKKTRKISCSKKLLSYEKIAILIR